MEKQLTFEDERAKLRLLEAYRIVLSHEWDELRFNVLRNLELSVEKEIGQSS